MDIAATPQPNPCGQVLTAMYEAQQRALAARETRLAAATDARQAEALALSIKWHRENLALLAVKIAA